LSIGLLSLGGTTKGIRAKMTVRGEMSVAIFGQAPYLNAARPRKSAAPRRLDALLLLHGTN
jgi:hypothetical protein